MAYRNNQPFNENHLRPCPMLENPEILQRMVKETRAKSTDLQSPETVDHLCGKCSEYAKEWAGVADKILIIKSLLMRIIRNKFANFQKSAMIVSRKKT